MATSERPADALELLVGRGVVSADALAGARREARERGRRPEWILVRERGVPRRALLDALSAHYGCPAVEFDERLPVPPELLAGADAAALAREGRFPLLRAEEGTVVAAVDPGALPGQGPAAPGPDRIEPWVALEEDIGWYIEDFLHAPPGRLVGTERTALAFWRNTMAEWRTRLACYRTDFAKSRTSLALLRWGLGLVALADALLRTPASWSSPRLSWALLAAGLGLAVASVPGYWCIRRSGMRPPGHQTLVEVTAATLHFLDDYTPVPPPGPGPGRTPARLTMLARLDGLLEEHRRLLDPPPVQEERTPLARERNVLAGQRTVAACYRTIYARARTGLAFIRTGVSFAALGLGLIRYFGPSLLTVFDALLIVAGLLLAADGLWWYLPVRREQAEMPRGFSQRGSDAA